MATGAYKLKYAYRDPRVAETYDEIRFADPEGKRQNAATLEAVERALGSLSGASTVLDIPCGTGRLTHFLVACPSIGAFFEKTEPNQCPQC